MDYATASRLGRASLAALAFALWGFATFHAPRPAPAEPAAPLPADESRSALARSAEPSTETHFVSADAAPIVIADAARYVAQ